MSDSKNNRTDVMHPDYWKGFEDGMDRVRIELRDQKLFDAESAVEEIQERIDLNQEREACREAMKIAEKSINDACSVEWCERLSGHTGPHNSVPVSGEVWTCRCMPPDHYNRTDTAYCTICDTHAPISCASAKVRNNTVPDCHECDYPDGSVHSTLCSDYEEPRTSEAKPGMCKMFPNRDIPCGCVPKSPGHWCAHSLARATKPCLLKPGCSLAEGHPGACPETPQPDAYEECARICEAYGRANIAEILSAAMVASHLAHLIREGAGRPTAQDPDPEHDLVGSLRWRLGEQAKTISEQNAEIERLRRPGTLTLQDAIAHADERSQGNDKCAAEHRQLAMWLRELEERRTKNYKKYKGMGSEELSVVIKKVSNNFARVLRSRWLNDEVARCPMYWGEHAKRCMLDNNHEDEHLYAQLNGSNQNASQLDEMDRECIVHERRKVHDTLVKIMQLVPHDSPPYIEAAQCQAWLAAELDASKKK